MTLQMANGYIAIPGHWEDWELPQCEGQRTKAESAAEAGGEGQEWVLQGNKEEQNSSHWIKQLLLTRSAARAITSRLHRQP